MPVLYVVATPIGNLGDMAPRAADTLRAVDLIVAEDTRVTKKLLSAFDIHTPLVSCHRHNEAEKGPALADKILENDMSAALVTDAGTPGVSDPGWGLVSACAARGIPVIPVPGCCAAAAALSVSGFDTREFAFYGFLPREQKARREKLRSLPSGPPVAVLYESPFRLTELLRDIRSELPKAVLLVCGEMTKAHEKSFRGSAADVLAALEDRPDAVRGEFCIALDLHGETPAQPTETDTPAASVEARLADALCGGMDLRTAQDALIAAGIKKNAVKQAALRLKKALQI